MTTDPFTKAAEAEAMRAYRDTGMPRYVLAVHMAEWARTHLAAQEPTTAEVKAFQDCLYERTLTWVPGVEVRAALSAARAARRDEEDKP